MKYIRFKPGVASSLNYVNLTNAQNDKSQKLIPYPDWETSFIKIDNPNTMTTNQTQPAPAVLAVPATAAASTTPSATPTSTVPPPSTTPTPQPKKINPLESIRSAQQIRVDRCDRLWVLDTGVVDMLENPKEIAKPAIVIFNLNETIGPRFIDRIEFDPKVVGKNSILGNMVSTVLINL